MPRSFSLPRRIAPIAGWSFLVFLAGCSTPLNSRVTVENAALNGRPAVFMLDTGSSATLLSFAGAQRLGVKYPELAPGEVAGGVSEPVHVTVGGQTITRQLPVTDSFLSGADGLVGWPEIRNNILVFDGAHRVVTAAHEVPAATSGWLKLHIHKAATQLLLEIPIASDKPGIVLIDTGSPIGISVPSGQWLRWREQHPQAAGSFHGSTMLSGGYGTVNDAWADEFNLGSLLLTDVPVAESSPAEVSQIENYVGTIGLYGIARMDLVVDARGGFAYLRPKPPPGPYFPGFDRPGIPRDDTSNNWTLEGEVTINFASLSHFVQLLRGVAKQAAGDDRGALDEYNAVLRLAPGDSLLLLNREALQLRLGAAPADFAQRAEAWTDDWQKSLAQFVAGELDEPSLLAAAQSGDAAVISIQQCQAFYYVGMMRLLKGDAGGARLYWKKSLNTAQKSCWEYSFARAEYTRLNRLLPPVNHLFSFN